MEIKTEKENDTIVLKLSGQLDTLTSPFLQEELEKYTGEEDLILDTEDLEYISSSGLRVLLSAQKKWKEKLTVRHVRPIIMEVFELTGFDQILKIEDTK